METAGGCLLTVSLFCHTSSHFMSDVPIIMFRLFLSLFLTGLSGHLLEFYKAVLRPYVRNVHGLTPASRLFVLMQHLKETRYSVYFLCVVKQHILSAFVLIAAAVPLTPNLS